MSSNMGTACMVGCHTYKYQVEIMKTAGMKREEPVVPSSLNIWASGLLRKKNRRPIENVK